MKASLFVQALRKKYREDFEEGGDRALAARLGIPLQTITKWSRSDSELNERQIVDTLLNASHAAIVHAQYHTIKPIVEFYPLNASDSKRGVKIELFPLSKEASSQQNAVRNALKEAYGVYIFYDSRGQALYAGKAKKQTLWKEINSAYNRARGDVQSIRLTDHTKNPSELIKQPVITPLSLYDLSWYFSAYSVAEGMIDDLEALLVRGFANDLLNKRMEKFGNIR